MQTAILIKIAKKIFELALIQYPSRIYFHSNIYFKLAMEQSTLGIAKKN